MHHIDIDLIEMTLDVMKYVIGRVSATEHQIGKPRKSEDLKALVGDTVTPKGVGGEYAFNLWKEHLAKTNVPVDHPRNLAFVPASPTKAAIMFDLITSASSIHGAYWMEGAGGIFCENEAMSWIVSLTGMPEGAFGVFTSGGTAANLSAIVTAREHWRENAEFKGEKGLIITSIGAHSSIKAMAKVADVDIILVDSEEHLTGAMLEETIATLTEHQRKCLFAVVATGGTTNAGIIDDLSSIAEVCEAQNLWFHIDAAYGGGALVADSVRHLFKGIERADSITIDPHKWMFSPYDCGAVLYRDMELAKNAHSQQGSYLEIFKDEGAHGFNPTDYQIQLTRRVRGLPLWFSLATHGTDRYKEAVERGLELAQIAGRLIEAHPKLELVREPSLSCVLYRRIGWEPEDYTHWTYENHKKGFALVTPTKWKNGDTFETCSRFCFINPDTTERDIEMILETME
ncbi:pyridoxal phosphate-dependent decarboxylase family protein [Winogradskyella arenosi]|uniref:Pyridoxal-dependent decarboxylase-like protein n=1 Tax=Winogradskyella arenosi TaxID=533325 RepID=A0A368ZE76_9FLAO|nr:aminotransferase class V-fold PLP-dependent enzyme [Winogradskyella arenosi]RCW91552.1 pyridoxal-dependent decarboxylase-like protein [Winogradskyella arenosi]